MDEQTYTTETYTDADVETIDAAVVDEAPSVGAQAPGPNVTLHSVACRKCGQAIRYDKPEDGEIIRCGKCGTVNLHEPAPPPVVEEQTGDDVVVVEEED